MPVLWRDNVHQQLTQHKIWTFIACCIKNILNILRFNFLFIFNNIIMRGLKLNNCYFFDGKINGILQHMICVNLFQFRCSNNMFIYYRIIFPYKLLCMYFAQHMWYCALLQECNFFISVKMFLVKYPRMFSWIVNNSCA